MANSIILVTLGALLLAGLALDGLGSFTRLPRVTLLVLFGLLAGPSGLSLIPERVMENHSLFAATALAMVAFLLGGQLTPGVLRTSGRQILWVSVSAVLMTALIVAAGLYLAGVDPLICMVMAGISAATAPAATADVVRRSGINNRFTRTLLGIVAIDDAWALLVFSLLLAAALSMTGQDGGSVLMIAGWEIAGAVILGVVTGVPAALLTGRLKAGEPLLTEALGVVFLTAGLALWLEVSYLLAGMVCGFVIANLARHHERAFHEIEHIEWPFMVFFFVLAGASIHLADVPEAGLAAIAYFVLRVAGRIAGGWLGARAGGMVRVERNWIGMALMPQAGVAIGMALIAAESLPSHAEAILAIAVTSTVAFELAGPFMTQLALSRVSAKDEQG